MINATVRYQYVPIECFNCPLLNLFSELAHQAGYDDGSCSDILIGLTYSGTSGWGRPDGSSLTYLRWYINNDVIIDGRYPAGVLCTRRQYTSYMSATRADVAFPFICQSAPITDGGK